MEYQVCPLCHSKYIEKIEGISSPLYFICTNCKLIFMHDSYILHPTDEKARYDLHQNSLNDKGYVAMFERFISNVIAPYTPPGASALDYGSGPVPVLQYMLQDMGYTTDVYDRYYAPDPTYEGKMYDLITTTETIEHVQDAAALWSLFAKHLHAGGVLSVMTLFHPGPNEFVHWWYRRDATHIRFYHSDTFQWISRHFPFKILWQDGKNTICFKKL